MGNILKIIYDRTINNTILNLKDIEKILELLVIDRCLNNYILNIDIQQTRSNNLASYSSYTKEITIYIEMIEQMVKNIEKSILDINIFEIMLYKNLSILQVLLHEVEHANQQKIAYNENNLEAFILRLSFLVSSEYDDKLYECCPEERLAEIKSFGQIIDLMGCLNIPLIVLPKILETEEKMRLLRGYHYRNLMVNVPLIDYFNLGDKGEILECFDFLEMSHGQYSLNERLTFGFPISIDEYGGLMRDLVLSLNKNFNNKLNIIKY